MYKNEENENLEMTKWIYANSNPKICTFVALVRMFEQWACTDMHWEKGDDNPEKFPRSTYCWLLDEHVKVCNLCNTF